MATLFHPFARERVIDYHSLIPPFAKGDTGGVMKLSKLVLMKLVLVKLVLVETGNGERGMGKRSFAK